MNIKHITINGQPFEVTSEGVAAAREYMQLVKHRRETGGLSRPEPDVPRPPDDSVLVYFKADASAFVNLENNSFELLDLDISELDPDDLSVWAELSEADDQRARQIVASLGHAA